MVTISRTSSDDLDFQKLVQVLDQDLMAYYKEENGFYGTLNAIEKIKYAVVAYDENKKPIGCGGLKRFSEDEVEIKRMYVSLDCRGKGVAIQILSALEDWSKDLKFKKCILETLKKKPYAIRFYEKSNYKIIPNFGDYANANNSICFAKTLE